MWDDRADTLLVKLWDTGHSMGKIAADLARAGYNVSRSAIAGRKHRLIKRGIEVQREGKRTKPVKQLARMPTVKRVRVEPEVAQAAVAEIEAASIDADAGLTGVDYFENEGCKAVLDTRGDWDLPRCCGEPRGYDSLGRDSPYCPTHHARFNIHVPGSRRTY